MYECACISIKLTVLFSFYYVIFFPLTHFKAKVKKKTSLKILMRVDQLTRLYVLGTDSLLLRKSQKHTQIFGN